MKNLRIFLVFGLLLGPKAHATDPIEQCFSQYNTCMANIERHPNCSQNDIDEAKRACEVGFADCIWDGDGQFCSTRSLRYINGQCVLYYKACGHTND